MIPIRTLLRSLAEESRLKIIQTRAQAYMKANPTETRLGMTTAATVFARTSQAQHDLQLNKAMNMRCRSPEQHKRKATTNSHTGNSTSTSLCTTSSPSSSSVCRRGGEGEGALCFPVLWVILPHPAPVVPCLELPHVCQLGTGWPTCRVGCRRCKTDVRDAKRYRCLHAFSQHAKRQADMQGWQPEMQKKTRTTTYYHIRPRTTTYCQVLPRTTTYYHVLLQA